MGRKKINIKVIEDTRQRTVTFARRRAGLIKKAHELSVLCGVRVGIVMFDTRDASHVYSSSGKPEEIFARYLSKQFHTNESRKRKSVDKDTGTYGFENGSFVRRHLAVVNEYTVGPDGTGSRNLSVKSNKQYHDPNKVSMQAAVSRVDPPVRSTSLSKHKELVQPAQSLNLANNMDPLMLATQDLSSLTFLPENASDPAAINFGCSKDILKLIDENRMCGGSPISNESACGSSTAANSVYDPQLRYYEDCSEQVPKRVKTQTESLFGTNVHSHDQNSSMLDRLLYDPDLANILSNQWQNKHAPNADEHIYSSSTSYGDPEDDDDVDDDDEEVEGYMDLEDDEDDDEDDDGDDDDDDDDDTDSNTVEEEKMSCKDTNNASASDNKPKSSLNRRADETQLSNVTTSSTSSTDTVQNMSTQLPYGSFTSLPSFTYPTAPPQLCTDADLQALASVFADTFSAGMPACPISSMTTAQAPAFNFESLGVYQSNNQPMMSAPRPAHEPSTIQHLYPSEMHTPFTVNDYPIF